MSTTYESAPEVADVVLSVAQEDHPELLLAPIVAVFRSPPAKSKGRVKLASVKPIQGLPAYLVDALGAELGEGCGGPGVRGLDAHVLSFTTVRRRVRMRERRLRTTPCATPSSSAAAW